MDTPRTFWQYLKGPMHTIELRLSPQTVRLEVHRETGVPPEIQETTLDDFLQGGLNEAVANSMNAGVLPEALATARLLKKKLRADGQLNPYLDEALEAGRKIPVLFLDAFAGLSSQQLNWKPSQDRWSIGECIDHLIVTNRSYFAQLDALARGDKYESFWENLPLFHGMFGKMLLKATTEQVQKKGNTPSAFAPTRSELPADVVAQFASQHADLIAKLEKLNKIDHAQTIISSPASSLITYSLKDAVQIIFQHERRHFQQAKALLSLSQFPKA